MAHNIAPLLGKSTCTKCGYVGGPFPGKCIETLPHDITVINNRLQCTKCGYVGGPFPGKCIQ